MSDDSKTFFGMPVRGDVNPAYRSRRPQLPAEELHAAILELFEDPQVEAVRWRQYTPYFNDGEPCVFGVHGTEFKLSNAEQLGFNFDDYESDWAESEDDEDDSGFVDEYAFRSSWAPNRPEMPASIKAFPDLDAFENVLMDAFGDHARVTVRRSGIRIDSYDHD